MRRGMWIICYAWVYPGALARAVGVAGSAHISTSVLGELQLTLREPWNPGPRAEVGKSFSQAWSQLPFLRGHVV